MAEYKIIEKKDMILNMEFNHIEIARYYVYKKVKFIFWDDWQDVSQFSDGHSSLKEAQERIEYLEYVPKSKVVGRFKLN